MRVSLPVIIMDMPATGFFKYLSEMDFNFVFKPGVDGWTSNAVSGVVVVEVVDGISQCRRKRRCWQGLFQEDRGRDRLDISAPSSAATGPQAVVLVIPIAAGTLFSTSFERRPLSDDDDEGLSLIPSTILSRLAVLR